MKNIFQGILLENELTRALVNACNENIEFAQDFFKLLSPDDKRQVWFVRYTAYDDTGFGKPDMTIILTNNEKFYVEVKTKVKTDAQKKQSSKAGDCGYLALIQSEHLDDKIFKKSFAYLIDRNHEKSDNLIFNNNNSIILKYKDEQPPEINVIYWNDVYELSLNYKLDSFSNLIKDNIVGVIKCNLTADEISILKNNQQELEDSDKKLAKVMDILTNGDILKKLKINFPNNLSIDNPTEYHDKFDNYSGPNYEVSIPVNDLINEIKIINKIVIGFCFNVEDDDYICYKSPSTKNSDYVYSIAVYYDIFSKDKFDQFQKANKSTSLLKDENTGEIYHCFDKYMWMHFPLNADLLNDLDKNEKDIKKDISSKLKVILEKFCSFR